MLYEKLKGTHFSELVKSRGMHMAYGFFNGMHMAYGFFNETKIFALPVSKS